MASPFNLAKRRKEYAIFAALDDEPMPATPQPARNSHNKIAFRQEPSPEPRPAKRARFGRIPNVHHVDKTAPRTSSSFRRVSPIPHPRATSPRDVSPPLSGLVDSTLQTQQPNPSSAFRTSQVTTSSDGDMQSSGSGTDEPATARQTTTSRLRSPKFMLYGYIDKFDDYLNDLFDNGTLEIPERSIKMLEKGRRSLSARAALYQTTDAQVLIWDEEDALDSASSDDDEPDRVKSTYPPQGSTNALDDPPLDTHLPDEETFTSREQDSARLAAAFQRSWHRGIKLLMDSEMERCNLPAQHRSNIMKSVYEILVTMHKGVFQGHLHGNLPEQEFQNPTVHTELRKIKNRAARTGQPGIYRQALVDDLGQSLTVNDHFAVLDRITLYMSRKCDPHIVHTIDSFRFPKSDITSAKSGFRKYLSRKQARAASRSRVRRLQLFCSRFRKRLLLIPKSEWDKPLKESLVEVGYSMALFTRMDQHRRHESSNFIMNLYEAVCDQLWPGKFTLNQHIIHLICDPMHGALSEMVLTALGQGYIFNGGGFSFHPAGRNNATVKEFSADMYKSWRSWSLSSDTTKENHEAYKAQREREIESTLIRSPHSEDDASTHVRKLLAVCKKEHDEWTDSDPEGTALVVSNLMAK